MKETQFLFLILECLSNVPSNIVYSVIGADSLRITRRSNNPNSFSASIKLLFTRMSRQETFIYKKNIVILEFFNKHYGGFK